MFGVDEFLKDSRELSKLGRFAIITNQSSLTNDKLSIVDAISHKTQETPSKLVSVFGPQHGYFQTEQDNMIETKDSEFVLSDGRTVPLYSLYSDSREPRLEQIKDLDCLIFDLQDIGCRAYTYMLTLALVLKQASKYSKKIILLDRPNPIGLSHIDNGILKNVEGNTLEKNWESFIGWYELPLRHGLTMGELGKYFIQKDNLDIDYSVYNCQGLSRRHPQKIDQYGLYLPSPNIPKWESCFLFPSFVALEGTNISEGRGTTTPFQLIGSPFLNSHRCKDFLIANRSLYSYDPKKPSISISNHKFRPTFNKYKGEVCNGLYFHIIDPNNIKTFHLGLLFLYFCCHEHPSSFEWLKPGYEYNFDTLPFKLIHGTNIWFNLLNDLKERKSKLSAEDFIKDVDQKSSQARDFYNKTKDLHLY